MPEMQPDSGTRSRTALKTIPLFQTNSETVPTLLSPLSPALSSQYKISAI